jgi:hypothetical protein
VVPEGGEAPLRRCGEAASTADLYKEVIRFIVKSTTSTLASAVLAD